MTAMTMMTMMTMMITTIAMTNVCVTHARH